LIFLVASFIAPSTLGGAIFFGVPLWCAKFIGEVIHAEAHQSVGLSAPIGLVVCFDIIPEETPAWRLCYFYKNPQGQFRCNPSRGSCIYKTNPAATIEAECPQGTPWA
jgi:hypothetical protein